VEVRVNIRSAEQFVRDCANGGPNFGVNDVMKVVDARTRCESDYGLRVQSAYHHGSIEAYNIRVASKRQFHLMTWKYENGEKVFPSQMSRAKGLHLVRDQAGFLTPSGLKHWWPGRDHNLSSRKLVSGGYWFPKEEMNPLIDQLYASAQVADDYFATNPGIKWMTESPGRQWTASFNPIVSTDDWYNKSFRNPLKIGISNEVYVLLRLAQKQRRGVFAFLNKDIVKLICQWVCQLMAEDGQGRCLGIKFVQWRRG
jgi:hypothetical protein